MPILREKCVTPLSQLKEQPIDWLWLHRIAAGSLTILDGDPGQGKSLLTLDLAARLSTGQPFPDGAPAGPPSSVVLLCGDDPYEQTIKPRLLAAGADCDRIHRFRVKVNGLETCTILPDDCGLIADSIREKAARLVLIDPFHSFLAAGVGSLNHLLLRQVMMPLTLIARQTGAAFILVRHLTKGGQGRRALYRGLGGIAIIAAARTAFLAGPHPDHPDHALLAPTKSNLSLSPPTLAFRVLQRPDGLPAVEWLGPVSCTAHDIVLPAATTHGEVLPEAMAYLQDLLAHGPATRDTVLRLGHAKGLTLRTLERAKAELEIVSTQKREDGRNVSYWSLPIDHDSERILRELFKEAPEQEPPTDAE